MRTKSRQWHKMRKQLGRELARLADQEQEWLGKELSHLVDRAQERYGATKAQVAEELVNHLDRYQANANDFMEGMKDRIQPSRKRQRRNLPWTVLAVVLALIVFGRLLWRRSQQMLPTQQTTE